MNTLERDELLIKVATQVEHLCHVVDGNGNPGLISDVAVLKAEHAEMKNLVPSARERRSAWVAIAVALIGLGGTLGVAVIGMIHAGS